MTPKRYADNFGNVAYIEKLKLLPYKGSPVREDSYVLSLYSTYDGNYMYYRSVFSTLEDAENKLYEFSCNSFRETK